MQSSQPRFLGMVENCKRIRRPRRQMRLPNDTSNYLTHVYRRPRYLVTCMYGAQALLLGQGQWPKDCLAK